MEYLYLLLFVGFLAVMSVIFTTKYFEESDKIKGRIKSKKELDEKFK